MAYDLNKVTKLLHIKTLVEKIKATFATKSEVNEVGQSLTTFQQSNTSNHNTMNQTINNLSMGLNSLTSGMSGLQSQISQMGQGIDSKIALAVSSAYKVKGYKTFAQLPTVEQMLVAGEGGAPAYIGYVYNVVEGFTTDDRFVEGAGKSYPAGTNVVCVFNGTSPQLDVLAGFIDLSGYVSKDELATDAEVDELLDELFGEG